MKIITLSSTFASRRSHISFYHNNKFFILGGYNGYDKVTKKLHAFDLEKKKVEEFEIENYNEYLSHHKCVFIGW